MSDKLIEHANEQRNLKQEAAQNAIKDIKETITTDTTLRNMPKDIFYSVFYPYFIGQKTISDDNSIIAKWVSYAGNARRGVNLLDDNGMIIGMVPGIISQTPVNFVQDLGVNFNRFGSDYELLKKRSTDQANDKADKMVNYVMEKAKQIEPDMRAFEKLLDNGGEYTKEPKNSTENTMNDDDYIIYD